MYSYRGQRSARADIERRGGDLVGPAPEAPRAPTEAWDEIAAENGYPRRPARLSRQRFFKLADDALGERKRTHGATYYTVPTPKETAVNLAQPS